MTKQTVPAHPTLAAGPGGPIPYELRVARDGRVWMSELQGNRLIAFTPGTGKFQVFTLPTPLSGPRRFDLDRDGIVWIPAYAANRLVRLDPATGRFDEIELPIPDAVPYVVRADPRDGQPLDRDVRRRCVASVSARGRDVSMCTRCRATARS